MPRKPKTMEIPELLELTDLSDSLLLGYYGGGNYGDELLLEVLSNLLKQHKRTDITVTYQNPREYQTFHHDFGYRVINMHSKRQLLGAVLRHKNIVIGGGGLWGLNFNFNVLLLSLLLFLARWLLGKRTYLLGVGYYGSTSRIGRLGAWLAGKGATTILARDQETLRNFSGINRRGTYLSHDIAHHIGSVNPKPYAQDTARLSRQFAVSGKTLFFTLRKLEGYYGLIGECLAANPDKPAIAGLLVPRHVRPDGYELLSDWQKWQKQVKIFDFAFNPLALYYFFEKHREQLAVIGPQYHIIITAYQNGVPFMPIVYDNKVSELLTQIGDTRQPLPVSKLTQADIQAFIDSFYGGKTR